MSMTENEAIGQLKYMYKTCMDEKCKHKGQCDLCCESRDMAIQALEEIQQYRAIGTIEEFKALKEKNNEHYSDTDELDGYGYTCTNKTCVERIRNKAIDEFAEKLKEKSTFLKSIENDYYGYVSEYEIDDVAEQMKAGVKNE